MKKMKKIMLVIMASVLFLMQPAITSVNNKYYQDHYNNNVKVEAGAVTTYLTWEAMKAAAVAAGSAAAPVAVGLVGAAAIGWVVDETIGWDVVAGYGQGIINHVLSLGGTVDDIYDAQSETVMLTPEMVAGASTAIDDVSTRTIIDANGWQVLGNMGRSSRAISEVVPAGYIIHFKADIAYSISASSEFIPFLKVLNRGGSYYQDTISNRRVSGTGTISVNKRITTKGDTKEYHTIQFGYQNIADGYAHLSNLRYNVYPATATAPADVIFGDDLAITDTLPTSVDARKELITNTIGGVGAIALEDAQAVTGVTFAEMAAATTAEDLDETTANDLGILGVLTGIYNFVKSLPVRIVGAFTSLFNMIINAVLAIPDVITSGVDNLLINVNALGNTIAGSLDDLLIDVNALGNSLWGSLDELLIDVNSLANSLATSSGALLINLGTWFDSLVNGIGTLTGSITGAITDAMTGVLSGLGSMTGSITDAIADVLSGLGSITGSITDAITDALSDLLSGVIALPATLINILVPDFSLVADKFGGIKLKMRDNPFTAFTGTLKNVFDMRKSIFDIRVTIKDKEYPLVPIALKSGLDTARNFLTGAIILIGSTIFYTRAKGMSWWK